MLRNRLVLLAVVAALHGAFFITYQAPEWATVADQEGYRRLGHALAETGRFTRYPDVPELVPEVIRTPGYPLFLAGIYTTLGDRQEIVAAVQTVVFVAIVLLVARIGGLVSTRNVALLAASIVALYPTFPYFGALVMTELWTTFALTLAFAAAANAWQSRASRDFALTGFLLGYAALCRPAFILLPFAFVATGTLLFWRQWTALLRPWAWMIGVFVLTILPWLSYNYAVMGRFALAPAGGVGRGLWEGSWQGTWSGKLHNALTQLAAEPTSSDVLDAHVDELARATGDDPAPMRTYVHQWREIRRIWDEPTDPRERAVARIAADTEYRRVGLENIGADVGGWLTRRLTYGLFVLWNADIWLRYREINAAPVLLIRAMWAVQFTLLLLGAWGIVALWRAGRLGAVWLLATPLLYVTAVHVPLLTEARQSLPVKPMLFIAAAAGITALRRGARAIRVE